MLNVLGILSNAIVTTTLQQIGIIIPIYAMTNGVLEKLNFNLSNLQEVELV